jgi:hypothetical protein
MRFETIDRRLIVGTTLGFDGKSRVSNTQIIDSHFISHISNLIKR